MKDIDYPAGGGLYIEYSTCILTNSTLCTNNVQYKPSSLTINDCVFEDNSGEVSDIMSVTDVWIIAAGSTHSSIGRGGGLSVTFEGKSENIEVTISNNTLFNRNKAYWGGGLFVEFHDNASHNALKVESSNFYDNSVSSSKKYGTGGGGARMAIIFRTPSHAFNNSITFEHCYFTNNSAKWGGGVSFYTAREQNVLEASNALNFTKCYWKNNSAWLGAAVDLDVHHADVGIPALVEFNDASVTDNSVFRANWTLLGVAVIYTDTVPIQFSGGSNYFISNVGSVIVASSGSITFKKGASAYFLQNYAQNGGAIQLAGNAHIVIGNRTQLAFYNNTAEQKGGAIFVQTISKHDLITPSPNCFIHYEDVTLPPKDWGANVIFIQNTASGKNNSIYTTTTIPCEWHDSHNATPGSNGSALCWKNWAYFNDDIVHQDNCSQQIETDPKEFTANNTIPEKLLITPGVQAALGDQYRVVDDFDNDATERLVLTASIKTFINSNETIKVNASIQPFITNNNFTMYGKTNNSYFVELYTMDPRVMYTTVEVELLPCPFGFVNNVPQDKDFSCRCDRTNASFNGIVECFQLNMTSSLNLLGQWAGYNWVTGHRVAGNSPYTENLNRTQLTFPPVDKMRDPSDQFCSPMNRMDVLCGKCNDTTGPSINSENYKCVNCPDGSEYYSWLWYIGSEILPLTIFFLILMLFNVSLTSGTANAFVFFSQIVTTTFGIYTASDEPYHALREVYRLVYGIWNLDIFSVLPIFQYCLSPKLDTLTVILLEYVIALYPLLVIFVLYSLIGLYNRGFRPVTLLCTPLRHCFIRLRNFCNPNSSLIDAIAAFILLSYSRMVQTSVKLLRYTTLYHEDGSVADTVVYYDGTMSAYKGKHVVYVVIALIVLIMFVATPPLVLILYPLKVFHRLTSSFCSLSGGRFEQFLNAFYGSYKDGAKEGTRDYRFFAGLYLIYRAVFALLRLLTSWQMIYLLQNTFCLLAVLTFTGLRPYRNDMHNKFDACIFSILLLISLLNQYNFNLVYLETDQSVNTVIFSFEYILIWTPFAVVTCLLFYYICTSYVKRVKRRVQRSKTLEATITQADIRPTASTIVDDNSIMKLMDERPNMYNYRSINISPIPSSDEEVSGGRGNSNRSQSKKERMSDSNRRHSNLGRSRPLLSAQNSTDDS